MKIDWLKDISIFSDFSEVELENLTDVFQKVEYAPSTIIFHEGEIGDRFEAVCVGEILFDRQRIGVVGGRRPQPDQPLVR